MNVFDLDLALITDYEKFARSFTEIRAPDLREQIDAIYETGRFWPEPLITVNPHFERGAGIDQLVTDGTLRAETGRIFRIDGKALELYRHQVQAISKAAARQSFVVTTGTGSGKSLCFFVPIADRAIRARLAGEPPRTKAIIVYPMNALANSQINEITKFLEQSGLPENLKPTCARYTGQDRDDERDRIRAGKPDILLTNFMMLELLMTRQGERDREIIDSAIDLDFLVLDEFHTYRGRQGADVAMLVRRVRDRLCRTKPPICIGTSATMSSEEVESDRATAVAVVATRLFGTQIRPDAVIDESLRRATDPTVRIADLGDKIAEAVDAEVLDLLDDAQLRRHPLAVWIELRLGLKDAQKLTRLPPTSVADAAAQLSGETGKPVDLCRARLQSMLTLMSRPETERGGDGEGSFLAFKLHRFVAGAGNAYATLRPEGQRRVSLDGQRFDPDDSEARLYPTHFCRACGQEYHSVTMTAVDGATVFLPRSIDDVPLTDVDSNDVAGYLVPEPAQDEEFTFRGLPTDFPEEWQEEGANGVRLKANKRKSIPRKVEVVANGIVSDGGRPCWFVPGKFGFCLNCGDIPPGQAREFNKLASLSAEGRSSATTLLVSSTLRWMNQAESLVAEDKRKLLGFTDNRQDAALQAGHFNDFIFVSLLRAATLTALRKAGANGLVDGDIGARTQEALGFRADNKARRIEWMLDPDVKGVAQMNANKAIARVLWYRVWSDQRRGWRYTNPNLEELGLIEARYLSLDELVADQQEFAGAPAELRDASPETRRDAYVILFDAMRRGLAVSTEVLDNPVLEEIANASRQSLREPWTIGQQERTRTASALMIDAPRREEAGLQGEPLVLRAGPKSALAKKLNSREFWGRRVTPEEYAALLTFMLEVAERYGVVRLFPTVFERPGWRLASEAVRFVAGTGRADGREPNDYFVQLYETLADLLTQGGEGLFGFEGREHTAQVDQERRVWREWRFRWGQDDQKSLADKRVEMRQIGEADDFLPVLFCSPTMELGVDISALNAVYLRNVPPTPANYAQRSGRAGRSGHSALVVTYCSAQGPHDQYYFSRRPEMVRGVVKPPAIELANRDLIEAHLNAVWLSEARVELPSDIPAILELTDPGLSVRPDIESRLTPGELRQRASAAMERVLESVSAELADRAPWAADRRALAGLAAERAFSRFSEAFERWRQLYAGARAQLEDANRKSEIHGLPAEERREAKARQAQAQEQIMLLERGNSAASADFFSYRYLATEGFLPGYNFPRLPLYAFIPSGGYQGSKAAYLQRARFLAISEFGPRSLIYHEGRAYRVIKARLPADLRTADGRLVTTRLFVCDNCGAAHSEEGERCLACGGSIAGAQPIFNILRIDNVETAPAERITANDEERQRQGFDIQTVFAWSIREGAIDVERAVAKDAEGPFLTLDYAPGALIRRVNKGLRRRKEKSILGFGIDPATGRWTKGPDEDEDGPPDTPKPQRVVPIVQDNKNATLIRFLGEPPGFETLTTLQHALTRGLEVVFQLEEGEILTEPTPSRDRRRAILAYEATEGGAGVLGRLVAESDGVARVARAALDLMHFEGESIDAAVVGRAPTLLSDREGAQCVKGCYRCLLSYYNQPDHELIDRTNQGALRLLLRMACSAVEPATRSQAVGDEWTDALTRWKLPPADSETLVVGELKFPLVWRAFLVTGATTPLDDQARQALGAQGYSVVDLPPEPGETAPSALAALLGG